MTDHREKTKGQKFLIRTEDPKVSFRGKTGEPAYQDIGDGFFLINGEVITADGDRFWAILSIDTQSSGEHWGTIFVLGDGELLDDSEDDFLESIGKTREQVYPYKYRYFLTDDIGYLYHNDHHVNPETGWSN